MTSLPSVPLCLSPSALHAQYRKCFRASYNKENCNVQLSLPLTFQNTNKALVFKTSFDPCLAFVNRKCGVSGKEWRIKTVDSVVLHSVFQHILLPYSVPGKKSWKQRLYQQTQTKARRRLNRKIKKQKDTDRRKPIDNKKTLNHKSNTWQVEETETRTRRSANRWFC